MQRFFALLVFLCALNTVDAFFFGIFDNLSDFLKRLVCRIPGLEQWFDCDPEQEQEIINKEPVNIPITNNGLFTVPLLELPLDLLDPSLVLWSSDPILLGLLLNASWAAPIGENSFSVFLGLNKGWPASREIALTIALDSYNPDYENLLSYPEFGIEPEPEGLYSANTLLIINHESSEDNIYRLLSIDPLQVVEEKASKEPSGGCCSILAVAHSLVRKMGGIVTKGDATNGDKWDPCFLRQLWAATGDSDYPSGGRGLTDSQGHAGHTAHWNDAWSVRQVDDDSPLFGEGATLSCSELKERCEKLEGRVEDTNDDVTMRIRGKEGKKGDEWGHRVPVESVTYSDGPPCTCEIEITRTSVQDPGNNNFEGIPFDPGTATYTITASDSGGATTVSNTEFGTSTITSLAFDSFDEEPRSSSVKPTDQGNRGTAFGAGCP